MVRIPFPENSTFHNIHNLAQIKTNGAKEYYIGYSRQSHRLEWFDLTNGTIGGKIKIPKTGPYKIPLVHNFYFHNSDSIFVVGLTKVIAMNAMGEVWYDTRINDPSSSKKGIDFSKQNIYNTPENASPAYYDAKSHSLYLAIKNGVSRYTEEFFEGNLIAKFDLKTKEITQLPIGYPNNMKGKIFPFDKPNFTVLPDKIIYNFQADSQIFVYDRDRQQTTSHPAATELIPSTKIAVASASVMQDDLARGRHISENPQFLSVTYDAEKDLYYRLTVAPFDQPLPQNRSGYHGKLYVSVYDSQFNLLTEEWLDDYRFTPNLMTSQGLMLLPNPNLTVEDALQALIIRADCK